MPQFDIHKIASSTKTERQNNISLGYFSAIAFPDIAHEEIVSILKENRAYWQSVWIWKGSETDRFIYPNSVLKLAKGKRENIISMVISGTSKSIMFIYELKEFADDFSITSAHALPDEKAIFVMYFIKK